MPYNRERGSKSGHMDLVKNPDVESFLQNCDYMREPSEADGQEIAKAFIPAPESDKLPQKVVASDASPYSEPLTDKFPSTQLGYVKVSLVLVDLKEFDALTQPGTRYVDPFKAAKLHRNANGIAFTLPGSNIRYKGAKTVRDGFRKAVYEQYKDGRTNFKADGAYSLADTLLHISGGRIDIDKCPSCGEAHPSSFLFNAVNSVLSCPACNEEVYLTDKLRLHEQLSDFGDNASAMTRFMNVTEHLLVASCVRTLLDVDPVGLSNMGFIVDGPLAIFGQPAKIHAPLMAFYHRVSTELIRRGLTPPVIVGLQKDGQVMEHARAINRFVQPGMYRPVDDDYRAEFIRGNEMLNLNFGHETYYGQDFILKTESGRIFTVGVPYPFPNKLNPADFSKKKVDTTNYGDALARAFALIRYFEFDLYENAVVPIALAHRHASISLVPGGKVLDLVTRAGLNVH
ncbi:uncharacterized protein NMK_1064 [Novimethylophilus kurashikiensis]|uniref:NurA domain-containing protein n=1 Tax=Novimethylophilus kurashikiensis TaxID=1825523 RepID=A0A2R5FA49_9PROT|nr:hypothetical protein [Novimethylophilus kurashikiensis]GBG13514.1 uncharacterized protein NMK_1064 [Novimethylophilus kurashikiensis]